MNNSELRRSCLKRKTKVRDLKRRCESHLEEIERLNAENHRLTMESFAQSEQVNEKVWIITDIKFQLEVLAKSFTELKQEYVMKDTALQSKDRDLSSLEAVNRRLVTEKRKLVEKIQNLSNKPMVQEDGERLTQPQADVQALGTDPDLNVPPQNFVDTVERKLKETAETFRSICTRIECLLPVSILSFAGIITLIMFIDQLKNSMKYAILGCGISWLVFTSLVSLLARRQVRRFFNSIERRFPYCLTLFTPFGIFGVLFGSILLTNFIESHDTWSWMALLFYVCCYLYVTTLLKTYQLEDFFGATDCILTISSMLAIKLRNEKKICPAVFWVYIVVAVALLFYRRIKSKKVAAEKTQARDVERA